MSSALGMNRKTDRKYHLIFLFYKDFLDKIGLFLNRKVNFKEALACSSKRRKTGWKQKTVRGK
jgi:hypothetical protein